MQISYHKHEIGTKSSRPSLHLAWTERFRVPPLTKRACKSYSHRVKRESTINFVRHRRSCERRRYLLDQHRIHFVGTRRFLFCSLPVWIKTRGGCNCAWYYFYTRLFGFQLCASTIRRPPREIHHSIFLAFAGISFTQDAVENKRDFLSRQF